MVASSQAAPEPRWDDVRLFLALYRERNLAAAGARVGLDASTLSRRLAALEDTLGAPLFVRTREGLLPTEAAEALLPAAEEMSSAQARFASGASSFEREAEGVVRLSVPPGIADAFVAPALLRLSERHPRIRIELDASVRLTDLTRREADLALRTVRPESGELVMKRVAASLWTPLVARKSALAERRVKRWDEVPWIVWGDDLAHLSPARWVSRHAPRADAILKTSHIAAQVAAVREGLGVALLPLVYSLVEPLVPLRTAKALAPSVRELPMNETWLVGHRALRDVPRVAAVWDFLTEEFRRLEAT